jgi:uncharacterized protein YkwD
VRPTVQHILLAVMAVLALFVTAAPAARSDDAPACPGADLQPAADNIDLVKAATLCLINAQRTAAGLNALTENERLTQASASFSQDMVARRYFDHSTPDGVTLEQRLTNVGYLSSGRSWAAGENLAWGQASLGTPNETIRAWMGSEGHRANILDARYREIGLGIATGTPSGGAGDNGATYATDFGNAGASTTLVARVRSTAGAGPRSASAACAHASRSARRASSHRMARWLRRHHAWRHAHHHLYLVHPAEWERAHRRLLIDHRVAVRRALAGSCAHK